MTRISPSIRPADVHDQRLWTFDFDLESGNERVLGIHHYVFRAPIQLAANCKLHGQSSIPIPSGVPS
jgi:hypothetical protein